MNEFTRLLAQLGRLHDKKHDILCRMDELVRTHGRNPHQLMYELNRCDKQYRLVCKRQTAIGRKLHKAKLNMIRHIKTLASECYFKCTEHDDGSLSITIPAYMLKEATCRTRS